MRKIMKISKILPIMEKILSIIWKISFIMEQINSMIYQYHYYIPKTDGGSQIHGWLAKYMVGWPAGRPDS